MPATNIFLTVTSISNMRRYGVQLSSHSHAVSLQLKCNYCFRCVTFLDGVQIVIAYSENRRFSGGSFDCIQNTEGSQEIVVALRERKREKVDSLKRHTD